MRYPAGITWLFQGCTPQKVEFGHPMLVAFSEATGSRRYHPARDPNGRLPCSLTCCGWVRSTFRSGTQPAAENLLLRRQLACYVERKVRPRRTDNASRIALVFLSSVVAWRDLLTIVRPDTLVRWHRDLYRLFWRWESRPRGRPRIPAELERLIVVMATASRTWGDERIAAELCLKLGLTPFPRTVPRHVRWEDGNAYEVRVEDYV